MFWRPQLRPSGIFGPNGAFHPWSIPRTSSVFTSSSSVSVSVICSSATMCTQRICCCFHQWVTHWTSISILIYPGQRSRAYASFVMRCFVSGSVPKYTRGETTEPAWLFPLLGTNAREVCGVLRTRDTVRLKQQTCAAPFMVSLISRHHLEGRKIVSIMNVTPRGKERHLDGRTCRGKSTVYWTVPPGRHTLSGL